MQPLRRILRPGLRLLRVLAHKPYATGYDKGKSDAVKQQYLIEVSIPWTTLGQTNITPGAALGLDVHINEDDNGGPREFFKAWAATANTSWTNPATFGRAVLLAADPAPPTLTISIRDVQIDKSVVPVPARLVPD